MADNSSTRLPRYPFTRSNAPADSMPRDKQASDPLSELARLIGQQDPFADPTPPPPPRRDLRDILSGRREPEVPTWTESDFDERRDPILPGRRTSDWAVSPPPADSRYDQYDTYDPRGYEEPAPAHNHFSHGQSGYERDPSDPSIFELPRLDEGQTPPPYEAPSDYGQGNADVPLYGDNGQLLHPAVQDEETYPPGYPAAPYEPEEAPPRSRKSLVAVIAVFCLAVMGTAGAYAYRTMFSGGTSGAPPLIRADSSPNKVAVAQTEGAGKQIYDRFGGDKSQNEKVVSREEQPIDVKPVQVRPSFQPPGTQNGTAPGWPTPAGSANSNAPAPTGGANAANEPRRIKTVPIRADQVASAPATAEPQPAPPMVSAPPPSPPAARSEPKPAAPARQPAASSSNGPLSLNPQGSARTASATPRAETTASGAYVVQLAAHKTQDEAAAAFRSAQSKYPSLLGSQRPLIRRKEVAGHGTFYGAQVGPFASRSDAVQLCESLKSAGGDCIVQRN